RIVWGQGTTASSTQTWLEHHLETSFTPASVLAATSEFVITFTATSAAPASFYLGSTTYTSINAPLPLVAIDVDNDGSIEYPNFANGLTLHVPLLPLGAAPVAVRVIMSSSVSGPGYS